MRRVRICHVAKSEWQATHDRVGSVYFILDRDRDRIKIGHSRDPLKRLRILQTGSSGRLSLVGVIGGEREVEQLLHQEHAANRVHLEWFSGGAAAVRWVTRMTRGEPMCRSVGEIVFSATVYVWWKWDAAGEIHTKHIWNDETQSWGPSVPYSGRANARVGWDSTTWEFADE